MAQVTVDRVLHLQDLGLERLDEDKAIVGFAQKAEARLVRWLDFAKSALLFLMVPGDNESEAFTRGCIVPPGSRGWRFWFFRGCRNTLSDHLWHICAGLAA